MKTALQQFRDLIEQSEMVVEDLQDTLPERHQNLITAWRQFFRVAFYTMGAIEDEQRDAKTCQHHNECSKERCKCPCHLVNA